MWKNNTNPYDGKKILDFVFHEILETYPAIRPETVTFAAMVFYPLALIEVETQEKSFEDFEKIELLLLRFIQQGAGEKEISALMGLSLDYIRPLTRLLRGYGHIDGEGHLTQLGEEAVQAEHKIQLQTGRQKVQLDVLNLALLPWKRQVDNYVLYERREASTWNTGVLSGPKTLDAKIIEERLKEQGYDGDFLQKARHVLHTNLEAITDIKCLELKYARSCMLLLDGITDPIVFGHHRVSDEHELYGTRSYVWLPFSVSTEELRQQYNFPSDTLVCADGAEYMHSLRQLFGQLYKEESTKIYKEKNQTKHERGSSEEKEYVFKQHFTNAYFGKNAFRYLPEKDMVSITSSGMRPDEFSHNLFEVLYRLGSGDPCYIAHEDACGIVLRATAGDDEVRSLAGLIVDTAHQHGKGKTEGMLRSCFHQCRRKKEVSRQEENTPADPPHEEGTQEPEETMAASLSKALIERRKQEETAQQK